MSKTSKINGNSMWPFFRSKQTVAITEVYTLKLGDVIVFQAPNKNKIFHRVVSINRHKIKCKGDNCLHFDWIYYDLTPPYRVYRHKYQNQVAKISKFWGDVFYRKYNKSPRKYHTNKSCFCFIVKMLQRITIYFFYLLYLFSLGSNKNV